MPRVFVDLSDDAFEDLVEAALEDDREPRDLAARLLEKALTRWRKEHDKDRPGPRRVA